MNNRLFNNKKLLVCSSIITFVLFSSVSFFAQSEIQAQDTSNNECEAFKEITTDKTEIRKQIRNRVIAKDNWNTDFAVPTAKKYDFFVGNMMPENDDEYEVSIYLKYPDGTNSMVYDRNVKLERGETYSLTFKTPTEKQPYQINVRVGGSNNNAYTISILGCE
jgi:hypothetical protein